MGMKGGGLGGVVVMVVLVQPRRRHLIGHWKSYMYDDMRRDRSVVLLPSVKERDAYRMEWQLIAY